MNNFSKGNELYNVKNYEEALNYYEKAIENNECEYHSYYNAGVCYIKLKEYDKAINMITKALELNNDSKYFFNLAYCYSMTNNQKKALIYFNLSWALDNNDNDCEKALKLITSKIKNN
ncbi:tetratricopeptide repeat protein [Clostridium tarantellae]|uniref:Tetratricopeptide repeat protein n=1 Tax=Clostridium tarantellae TaxID=39493 RepID=A0A6I1MVN6_9CLOT|nr:tetratricopeptide repeat protein [Clostridium tarantellae]MPQ44239.1 tetratricopeptide repeat protein [Clostridium tarantellae]